MDDAAGKLEQALLQIPEVRAARLVTDNAGNPVEVHIIATGEKSAKQVVRDVQTVSLASAGVSLDHRIVSVVHFPDEGGPASRATPARPSIHEIVTETKGPTSTVRVSLSRGGQLAQGEVSGPTSHEGLHKLAALAAMEAVKKLLSNGLWLSLDHVTVQRAGSRDVVLATLTAGGSSPAISLSGSAVVGAHHPEAAVRAVLDALNRIVFRS